MQKKKISFESCFIFLSGIMIKSVGGRSAGVQTILHSLLYFYASTLLLNELLKYVVAAVNREGKVAVAGIDVADSEIVLIVSDTIGTY